MGKCCSKGAGYDERKQDFLCKGLDIQTLNVKRYNTEENQNNNMAPMSAGVLPRNSMNKKGSFALDDDDYQAQAQLSTQESQYQ